MCRDPCHRDLRDIGRGFVAVGDHAEEARQSDLRDDGGVFELAPDGREVLSRRQRNGVPANLDPHTHVPRPKALVLAIHEQVRDLASGRWPASSDLDSGAVAARGGDGLGQERQHVSHPLHELPRDDRRSARLDGRLQPLEAERLRARDDPRSIDHAARDLLHREALSRIKSPGRASIASDALTNDPGAGRKVSDTGRRSAKAHDHQCQTPVGSPGPVCGNDA
jgi:hypothetical protein